MCPVLVSLLPLQPTSLLQVCDLVSSVVWSEARFAGGGSVAVQELRCRDRERDNSIKQPVRVGAASAQPWRAEAGKRTGRAERRKRTTGRVTGPPRHALHSPGKSCLYVSDQISWISLGFLREICVLLALCAAGGEPAASRRKEGAAPAGRAGRHPAGERRRCLLLLRRHGETGSGSEEKHSLRVQGAAACPLRTEGGCPCPLLLSGRCRRVFRRRRRCQHQQRPAMPPACDQDAVCAGERGKKIIFGG